MIPRRVLPIALALLAAGCATNRYVGPTSGRSSLVQESTAAAVEKALEKITWDDLRGKTVTVRAASLTERFGGRSPEEVFLEEAILEKAVAAGAKRAEEGAAPDVEIHALARAIGVTRTRRDFILLYYAESVDGVADLRVSAYRRNGTGTSLLWSRDVSGEAYRRKAYVLYMFGPMHTRWEK